MILKFKKHYPYFFFGGFGIARHRMKNKSLCLQKTQAYFPLSFIIVVVQVFVSESSLRWLLACGLRFSCNVRE